MDTDQVIALALLVFATGVGLVASTLVQWVRDVAFFALAAGAVLTNRMDVNMFSQEWYRGTTRGVEVTALDGIALCLVVASVLVPRYKTLPRIYWPGALGFMLLYAAYGLGSVLTSEPKMFGAFELTKVLRGILFFMAAALFVRTRREVFILVLGLTCAVSLQGAMALKQRYIEGIYRVGGSVEDPNSLSMYICMVSPMLVAAAASDFPRWLRWFCWVGCGAAGLAVLLTISRAGIPIFAMVMLGTTAFCVSWKPTVQKAVVSLVISILVFAALVKAWDMVGARFAQATFEEEYLDDQAEGRGVYIRWAKAILKDHPSGVGLGNWSWWVSKVYGPDAGFRYISYDDPRYSPEEIDVASAAYAAPAHNLFVLTVGEMGWAGLFIFALIWLRLFWMGFFFLWSRSSDPMRRLGIGLFFAMGGVFLQSITEWTYRQTPIFITYHVLAGTLASLHFHKRLEARKQRENGLAVERNEIIEVNPDALGPRAAGGWN